MDLPKPRNIKVEKYVGGLSQYRKIDNSIKQYFQSNILQSSIKNKNDNTRTWNKSKY